VKEQSWERLWAACFLKGIGIAGVGVDVRLEIEMRHLG